MQEIRATVANEFEAVNQLIISQLHSNIPLVENIGHYIVDAGGKRLRPLLALLAGGLCGSLKPAHNQLAAVIEFIHTATLLHDDVVDLSSLRRGRPTANAEWGNAPSVLVGDFLYTRAFQMLVDINHMPLMRLVADTTNTIAEGEVLQLTKAGDPNTSEADYLNVIKSKTAVLFAAATAGAARLSQVSEAHINQCYEYGLNLGIAFQIIDDVLDYEGDPAEMGKNVGDDLAEGKPTLPLIYALQRVTPSQQALIKEAITQKSAANIDLILESTRSCGAIEYCRDEAQKYIAAAKKAINNFEETPYKSAALALCELALTRTH